ncbi:MAG TPA: archaellin/type IV pilin N-terminal domain-containing protein [Dehalococcoidia bacterium]|nr:archaellin/type IV pilin N-terminal domain-containing protein [Dehalococcoidia bacterium]
MLKRLAKMMRRDERGITGLETAIILIAFVVVASVFAYTVLSAGIFSSQKGQEAIHSGLEQARSTLEMKGNVVAQGNGTQVDYLVFCVANALAGEAIDLTPPIDGGNGTADGNSTNVVVISYSSEDVRTDDLVWISNPMGLDDGDNLLEAGELFEIVLDLSGCGETIDAYHTFTIQVRPPVGSVLVIERTTPAALDTNMILY